LRATGDHALAGASRRALDFRRLQEKQPGENFPVAVALGADPATILGAGSRRYRTRFPSTVSPVCCAAPRRSGEVSDQRLTSSGECRDHSRRPYAPGEMAEEGPFGDHTGYYNEVERFPVFTITRINPSPEPDLPQHYTGRPRTKRGRCWAWR